MNETKKISSGPEVEQAIDGHELSLSADKKWLRLTIAGKTTISFHVNYVNKVLGSKENSKSERLTRKPDPTATI